MAQLLHYHVCCISSIARSRGLRPTTLRSADALSLCVVWTIFKTVTYLVYSWVRFLSAHSCVIFVCLIVSHTRCSSFITCPCWARYPFFCICNPHDQLLLLLFNGLQLPPPPPLFSRILSGAVRSSRVPAVRAAAFFCIFVTNYKDFDFCSDYQKNNVEQ